MLSTHKESFLEIRKHFFFFHSASRFVFLAFSFLRMADCLYCASFPTFRLSGPLNTTWDRLLSDRSFELYLLSLLSASRFVVLAFSLCLVCVTRVLWRCIFRWLSRKIVASCLPDSNRWPRFFVFFLSVNDDVIITVHVECTPASIWPRRRKKMVLVSTYLPHVAYCTYGS
jgi:hypothetical protein